MIRSAAHIWFEAAIVRGAKDAELRALLETFKPMQEAARKVGIGFQEASRRMVVAIKAMQRASVSLPR